MLNAEKYKERIKELEYKFALCDGELKLCRNTRCDRCKFETSAQARCMDNKTKWLLEEYKEPILTDKEKELIKAIIKLFDENWLINVEWFETLITSRLCICAREKEDRTIVETIEIPTLLFKESMFQGLEKNRVYTLEELGL